jgi:hypothetical protein
VPSLTINQIVVPRQTGAHTPNGVAFYARWLLSRVLGVGQRVSPLRIPEVDRTPALGFRALLAEGGDLRVQLHRS